MDWNTFGGRGKLDASMPSLPTTGLKIKSSSVVTEDCACERQRAAAQKKRGDPECPLGRWVTEGVRLRKQQFSREVSQCELYMSCRNHSGPTEKQLRRHWPSYWAEEENV
jgi:hypothetical protein